MGMALITKRIVCYCQGNVVFAIHYTLLTRQGTSVLKVGMLCGSCCEAYVRMKEDWPIVFTIKVLAQDNFITNVATGVQICMRCYVFLSDESLLM